MMNGLQHPQWHPRAGEQVGEAARACRWMAALLIVGMTLAGCRPSADSQEADQSTDHLCLAILIDRSGSYEDFEQARRLAVGAASQLRDGDSILVRWISAESYRHKELVLDRRIPVIASAAGHVADRAGRLRARTEAQRSAAVTREVIQMLVDLSPARSGYTDVWGGILAAQEWLEATPCDRGTFVLVSDLQHNRGAVPELALPDVNVLVAGFEHEADLRKVSEIRKQARQRLEEAGARLVFLPPGRVPRLRGDEQRGS